MKKETKVITRKLGRHKAAGMASSPEINDSEKLIELDSRLTGIDHLDTLVHEILHILNPEWSERKIIKHSREMSKILWDNKYRRIDDGEI